ncbi:MAG: acyltransferase [Proteobacteria bacterium]|nr:acyltransferase [Pseudomonadota bacterium]
MSSPAASQRHVFATLDGLRGVAAIAVAVYHMPLLFDPVRPAAAYLAVDLFFCLSGFVIAHAYGQKLDAGMSLRHFTWLRLLRLYPLFALALVIQAVMLLASAFLGSGSLADSLRILLPAVLFLPNPWDSKLYPANEPAWSLFFELLVNFVAALCWRHLSTRTLIVIIAASALGLIVEACAAGTVDRGDMWSGFSLGLFRVFFSFFTGVLLYRERARIPVPRVPALLLVGVLLLVMFGARTIGLVGELASVLVVFPALVALGGATEPARPAAMLVAGRLSYAVYVLHVPLLIVALNLLVRLPSYPTPPLAGIVVLGGIMIVCWMADRWFDGPVRRALANRRTKARPGLA